MAVKKTKEGAENASSIDNIMKYIINMVGEAMSYFMHEARIKENLTPKERSRLISAGIRNYGFIEKTRDIGRDNPAFMPPHFNMAAFSDQLHDFDIIRQVYLVVEKFQTIAWDSVLIRSNDLYRDALRVYNGLKEQAKGQVPGAKDLFNALEPFFKRRTVSENQPTQKQELKKIKSIAKGNAEGEVLVRNIKPRTTGGVREVIEKIKK
jgi:hypothetical protein